MLTVICRWSHDCRLDRPPQALGRLGGGLLIALGKDHGELLTTIAGCQGVRSGFAGENLRDSFQDLVPLGMAKLSLNCLKLSTSTSNSDSATRNGPRRQIFDPVRLETRVIL